MASHLVYGGRLLFFALIVTQGFILAAYPAEYKANSCWYAVSFSYAPSTILWLCLVLLKRAMLRRSVYIWGLYVVVGLVPSISIVFGFVGDNLDNERFIGPVLLKTTLCITPLLLFLLLNTANDSKDNTEVVSKLCFQMAVDLFDSVDMLDIVLEEKEHNYGISKEFGKVMIVVACFSLLLSPWQMAENNLKEGKQKKRTALIRNIVEMVGVNLVFLIVRLVIVIKYKKDESIFIAKNVIAIILSIIQIRDVRDELVKVHPSTPSAWA